MRKCSVLVPLTPPYCLSLNVTSRFNFSKIKVSRTLEKSGVHDKFRSSAKLDGALFFGITLTVSLFQTSGQDNVVRVWLNMWQTGSASRSANWVTRLGLMSP